MNGKILIVDDEPAQQQLLRYNVEKSGFDVLLADNGNDALNIVDEVKPDLIVLDWMIPEASGIDVATSFAVDQKHATCQSSWSVREVRILTLLWL